MLLCELNNYDLNIISLVVSLVMMIIAAITLIVAVRSNRKNAEDFHKLISDTNRATKTNVDVEINKIELERFRLSMQILELEAKKKRLQANPNQNQEFLLEPPIKEQIQLIDEQLDRCKRLDNEMGVILLRLSNLREK